jgi:hypothetical protein
VATVSSSRERSISVSAANETACPKDLFSGRRGKQMPSSRDDSSPARLVARAKASAVIAMEVLIEQYVVAPMRIVLELSGTLALSRLLVFVTNDKISGDPIWYGYHTTAIRNTSNAATAVQAVETVAARNLRSGAETVQKRA